MQIPSSRERFGRLPAVVLRAPAAQILVTLAAVGLLTGLMHALAPPIPPVIAALIYILVVLLSAMAFGLLASLAAALLTSLVYHYSFVPPYGSFGITALESTIRLGVFVGVALLVSGLASRARRQTLLAQQHAAELNALYQLSQALSAEVTIERMPPIIAHAVRQILPVQDCQVMLAGGPVSADTALPAPAHTHEDIPLQAERRQLGVLRVARPTPGVPLTPAERELLETIAAQVSLVLERVRLTTVAGQAQALAESDRLKSTLLSLVSHDLRTPLAVIKGLATSLLDPAVGWTEAQRRDLLATIDQETDRLNQIVSELLEMSRIEAGAIPQARSWHALDELVAAVAEGLRAQQQAHPLQIDVPDDLPWVHISYAQVEQVLRNLLENAAHYAPAGSAITLRARSEARCVRVEVSDRGPGVPAELRERIFEKFVRAEAAERQAVGTGLGLAICKGLVEAHGGRIWVEDRPGGGASFVFTLPIEAEPQDRNHYGAHSGRGR